MPKFIVAASALMLTACTSLYGTPKSLDEIHSGPDWRQEKGETLAANYQRDMARWARGRPPVALRSELIAAKFECAEGSAVCTRMFSTRACQTDWRVELPAATGGKVMTRFTRECVGLDNDWPEPRRSALDDQLARSPPLN